jgi:molybdopterin-guanine dinucleotide biosynthesis protein A
MRPQARLFVETIVIDDELPPETAQHPLIQLYPKATKNSDYTNFWGAEARAIAFLEDCDLSFVSKSRGGERGIFIAIKTAEKQFCAELS